MHSESAVVSITFSPRSIACKCVIVGRNTADGLVLGIAVEHAAHAVLGHQDRFRIDFERSERGSGVGREIRIPGACSEDDDTALLEVPDRAPPDIGLGHLANVERREHPRVCTVPLECLLDGQRVEDRGEHPHVVARRPVHPGGGGLHPAVHVAAADHERQLEAGGVHVDELTGERIDRVGVETVLGGAHQCLAGQLEQHPAEDRCERGARLWRRRHQPTENQA